MNTAERAPEISDSTLDAAIEAACGRIAPTWPLDQFIAVNPYWGWLDETFDRTAAALGHLAGSPFYLSRDYYRGAWKRGEIGKDDLVGALEEADASAAPDELVAALNASENAPASLKLPSEIADRASGEVHRPKWDESITHQVSQFCAAWYDQDQADWKPPHGEGLYEGWRHAIQSEHGLALLMGAPQIVARAGGLPTDPMSVISEVLENLAVPEARREDVLTACLLRVGGWAAWCAYRRWSARLEGSDDNDIIDLLAIRLAWEQLLDDDRRDPDSPWARWNRALGTPADTPDSGPLPIWQRAHEIAFQRQLITQLEAPGPIARPDAEATGAAAEGPELQAVFCIDVRSEVFRRALEKAMPGAQTLGFAGFFGLPIAYTPIGTGERRPQLPGLLAPTLEVSESCGDQAHDHVVARQRSSTMQGRAPWRAFSRVPASAFTLVEALGLGYLGKLLRRSLRPDDTAPRPHEDGLRPEVTAKLKPVLSGGSADARADLAEQVLKAMGLTGQFARWVLLAGHGSRSANNPHAAGLDCGACCGQTGEVNARALAGLLNDADVRARLANRGIRIPVETRFVAALHDTTIDEVTLFDLDGADPEKARSLARVERALEEAGRLTRAERAPALGLEALEQRPAELERSIRARGGDWSQTRPEWGLAGNGAFIVAPRERSRGIDLAGRAFLHDYDWRSDENGSVIELIMTAPMVVTHWINMQYYASTVDNRRFGSGNKVIHNVVGGRIGVFEGNGGDLRIGLSKQSLHDGQRWIHEPLRLSVFIEAPREMIDTVIDKHDLVRSLVDNRWLHLFRIDPETGQVEARVAAGWAQHGAGVL